MEMLQSIMTSLKSSESGFLYTVYAAAMIIGGSQLILFLYSLFEFIHRHFMRQPHNLYQRYAAGKPGAWAVVTGASDGIGAAFCELLAKEGFNIVLLSRSVDKMQAVAEKCKAANRGIETMIVQADFSNAGRPKKADVMQFYQGIFDKLKVLDIAILVNNAGVMYTGRMDAFGPDAPRWKEMLDVNVMHVTMMTTLFKDKLVARQAAGPAKSALINVSSAMGYL
jgi:17beta-estradiol 17-dehydrogenase / very-long-chain 3-oxoacyl-CoA reductase